MLLPLLRTAFLWPDRANLLTSSSAAPTDVLQHANRYELDIDLPGVDPSNIKLELSSESATDNYLQISSVVKELEASKGDNDSVAWLRRERQPAGSFQRVFALPGDVDLDRIKASLDKGVLKVILPRLKVEQQRPTKRIPLSKL
eukprot:GHUV01007797.1.p1 GENE.GHUV01007797.1~~GHUV01007797.1.p1  ORF type:complete len:144 (+),score=41.77 GHUV01007797.1:177-608(+)